VALFACPYQFGESCWCNSRSLSGADTSPEKKEESDAYDEDCGNYGNAVLSAACGNIDET
jgi:hypothetical protein